MKIINGCERFSWKRTYWVNDGYGKIETNSKSGPRLSISSKENAKNKAIKVVDCIINKMITPKTSD